MSNDNNQEIEKRKRPEVARYKPGAFKHQEPEELLPGLRETFDQRSHGGGGVGYRGGGGGGFRGQNTRRPRQERGGHRTFNRNELCLLLIYIFIFWNRVVWLFYYNFFDMPMVSFLEIL